MASLLQTPSSRPGPSLLATSPRADELDLARACVDLSLLNLPQLLLVHRLQLVCLRDLCVGSETACRDCAKLRAKIDAYAERR